MYSAKTSRSNSIASTASASSSYSRTAEDLLDRLLGHEENTTVHVWSAGNLRINDRDLTVPMTEAHELIDALKKDQRFALLNMTYLDEEGSEWKATYRLQHGQPRVKSNVPSGLSISPLEA